MKKLIFLSFCFVFCFFKSNAQNTVNFAYDNAGNLTQRSVQVIPISNNRLTNPISKDSSITDKTPVLKIYPNPSNDVVNIEGQINNDNSIAELFLRNNNGMVIRKDNYDGRLKTIKVSDLASGIYFLEIKYAEKKSVNYKIVIAN